MNIITPIQHTLEVLNTVKERSGDKIIVSFSGGKDSLVMMDCVAKVFSNIKAFYLYFIPDLNIDKMLYDKFQASYPDVELFKCIHPQTIAYKQYGYMCDSYNTTNRKPKVDFLNTHTYIKQQLGYEWISIGWRQSDGLNRRIALRTYENHAIQPDTKKVYPLSIWNKKDIFAYAQANRIILPDYATRDAAKRKTGFGIGLDYDSLSYMKDNHPADYAKIRKVFPYCEVVFKTKEMYD